MPQTRIRYGHAMHPGTRLTVNSAALALRDDPVLLAIIDGRGHDKDAAECAKLASTMLAKVAARETLDAQVHAIGDALDRAHGVLQKRNCGASEPLASLVSFTLVDGRFSVLWAGDARAYLMRDGTMRLLTCDHVEIGMRARLTKGLGGNGIFSPSGISDNAQPGDRLLLCSAALAGVLGERTMANTLSGMEIETMAEALVQDALIANVRENVSAIVIGIETDA